MASDRDRPREFDLVDQARAGDDRSALEVVVGPARYAFTCCDWDRMSRADQHALVELVNAAGDEFAQRVVGEPERDDGQREAIERMRAYVARGAREHKR